jgi:hypothetical protein
MRQGLDALEHSSVSLRTLFRAIDDATRQQTGVQEDPGYADEVRQTAAKLLQRMATVIRQFGALLVAETDPGSVQGEHHLAGALEALRSGRALVYDLLIKDPRSRHGLWELNSALLTAVDRMLVELDVAGRTGSTVSRSYMPRTRRPAARGEQGRTTGGTAATGVEAQPRDTAQHEER